MVQSTGFSSSHYPASNVLILGQEDTLVNQRFNYWLGENNKTTGQGFTLKLDDCARMIAGCQIKNKGKGSILATSSVTATRGFKILGSKNKTGPWEILVEDELIDTRGGKPAALLNFSFEKPVEIQFIKFELVSYWGLGGGLQYFAAIPGEATTTSTTTTIATTTGTTTTTTITTKTTIGDVTSMYSK